MLQYFGQNALSLPFQNPLQSFSAAKSSGVQCVNSGRPFRFLVSQFKLFLHNRLASQEMQVPTSFLGAKITTVGLHRAGWFSHLKQRPIRVTPTGTMELLAKSLLTFLSGSKSMAPNLKPSPPSAPELVHAAGRPRVASGSWSVNCPHL